MKKVDLTHVSQYCMEPLPVSRFIQSLPKKALVYEMRFRGTYRAIAKKLATPEYIKKMGVQNATNIPETVNVTGVFRNGMTKERMLKSMGFITKSYNIPDAKFHVQKVTLMDGHRTNSLTFKRMYKQIRLPDDKRKKKIVLGMVHGAGSDYHNFLASLSATKITCTLAKTEKTIVMCSEEKALKSAK